MDNANQTRNYVGSRYVHAKEKASQLRKVLKTMGISSRQVSVRAPDSSSVNVRVIDPTLDLKAIETVADQYASIDRCEITGDILSGGNCYVSTYRA